MGLRGARGITAIETVPGVGTAEARRLRSLSIVTAEALRGAYHASPKTMATLVPNVNLSEMANAPELSAAFDGRPSPGFGALPPPGLELPQFISEDWLDDFTDRVDEFVPEFPAPAALADGTSTRMPAADGAEALDPPTVNLIPHLGPIRYQGTRSTCVAHAVGTVVEFHTGAQSIGPQYLYWQAKETDGDPDNPGTWIGNCMTQAVNTGAALEATWPYVPDEILGNEGQGPPPEGAIADAGAHRLTSSTQDGLFASGKLGYPTQPVIDRLAAGLPVAISVISPPSNWQRDPVSKQTGFITMPLPGAPTDHAHAVCAVGWGVDDDFPGHGYFIIRNSWGTGYYPDSPFGPGYAVLPIAYVSLWGLEAFSAPKP